MHDVHLAFAGVADKIMIVSMGDEISLADPLDAKDAFPKWCQVGSSLAVLQPT